MINIFFNNNLFKCKTILAIGLIFSLLFLNFGCTSSSNSKDASERLSINAAIESASKVPLYMAPELEKASSFFLASSEPLVFTDPLGQFRIFNNGNWEYNPNVNININDNNSDAYNAFELAFQKLNNTDNVQCYSKYIIDGMGDFYRGCQKEAGNEQGIENIIPSENYNKDRISISSIIHHEYKLIYIQYQQYNSDDIEKREEGKIHNSFYWYEDDIFLSFGYNENYAEFNIEEVESEVIIKDFYHPFQYIVGSEIPFCGVYQHENYNPTEKTVTAEVYPCDKESEIIDTIKLNLETGRYEVL